mmetsp:Transcript_18539/g.38598  ORF Transcript_18539/g.38598 Transcript_18539/m.38598 type:complete len:712 (+) Transcript_18539:2681-4816(+)
MEEVKVPDHPHLLANVQAGVHPGVLFVVTSKLNVPLGSRQQLKELLRRQEDRGASVRRQEDGHEFKGGPLWLGRPDVDEGARPQRRLLLRQAWQIYQHALHLILVENPLQVRAAVWEALVLVLERVPLLGKVDATNFHLHVKHRVLHKVVHLLDLLQDVEPSHGHETALQHLRRGPGQLSDAIQDEVLVRRRITLERHRYDVRTWLHQEPKRNEAGDQRGGVVAGKLVWPSVEGVHQGFRDVNVRVRVQVGGAGAGGLLLLQGTRLFGNIYHPHFGSCRVESVVLVPKHQPDVKVQRQGARGQGSIPNDGHSVALLRLQPNDLVDSCGQIEVIGQGESPDALPLDSVAHFGQEDGRGALVGVRQLPVRRLPILALGFIAVVEKLHKGLHMQPRLSLPLLGALAHLLEDLALQLLDLVQVVELQREAQLRRARLRVPRGKRLVLLRPSGLLLPEVAAARVLPKVVFPQDDTQQLHAQVAVRDLRHLADLALLLAGNGVAADLTGEGEVTTLDVSLDEPVQGRKDLLRVPVLDQHQLQLVDGDLADCHVVLDGEAGLLQLQLHNQEEEHRRADGHSAVELLADLVQAAANLGVLPCLKHHKLRREPRLRVRLRGAHNAHQLVWGKNLQSHLHLRRPRLPAWRAVVVGQLRRCEHHPAIQRWVTWVKHYIRSALRLVAPAIGLHLASPSLPFTCLPSLSPLSFPLSVAFGFKSG